jgi:hypothetical protein
MSARLSTLAIARIVDGCALGSAKSRPRRRLRDRKDLAHVCWGRAAGADRGQGYRFRCFRRSLAEATHHPRQETRLAEAESSRAHDSRPEAVVRAKSRWLYLAAPCAICRRKSRKQCPASLLCANGTGANPGRLFAIVQLSGKTLILTDAEDFNSFAP